MVDSLIVLGYILFSYIILVTILAISLFVALFVTIRRLDKNENTSLLDR